MRSEKDPIKYIIAFELLFHGCCGLYFPEKGFSEGSQQGVERANNKP